VPESRTYTEAEASQIIRTAQELFGSTDRISKEELVKAATEAGLPIEAVELAERQLEAESTESRDRIAFRKHHRSKLLGELGGWASICTILLGINLLTSGRISWSVWPVGIMSLLMLAELVEHWISQPWKSESKFKRWQRKQQKRG